MATVRRTTVQSYRRSKEVTADDNRNLNDKSRLREEYLRQKREEKEKEREAKATENDIIEVEDIEWYARSNAEHHNNSSFEVPSSAYRPLIVRRGQSFNICIHFNRQYDQRQDSVVLKFSIGSNPRASKGTLIELPVTNNKALTSSVKEWEVRLHRIEPKAIHLEIQISCKAAVGVWSLCVYTTSRNDTSEFAFFTTSKFIYILFNPWCKDDAVYMENEMNRKEYVLNDTGKLYVGSATNPTPRRWMYGQFSSVVLPAAMAILDKSSLDDTGRGSPVKVVRALSAMLNSPDDDGVLEGKWDTPYDDGIAPYHWTGSKEILERYLKNNFQPVKYGQCWVYAGLFTTVCRALGIPCRPVTNYRSAHDTDDTLTIDRFYSEEGDKLEDDDSIWNFHVWNDCWMTRPDLPPGYGGWQAVDATPQETSDGIYRAGPASLNAIKKGEVGYMYDSPFIFSEVNADVVNWQKDSSQRIGWRKLKTLKYHVGYRILTKKAGVEDYHGDRDLEDITEQYKYREESPEERLAVRNAATHGNYASLFDMPQAGTGDVYFDLVEIDKIMIGQSFRIIAHVENKSNEIRSITATLTADSVFYTGIKAHAIKHKLQKFILEPNQKEMLTMTVTAEEYYEKLVDYSMIKIYAMATVKQTKQTWAEEDDIALEKPCLKLEVSQPLEKGKKFELPVTFKNPLSCSLQKCSFALESSGLTESQRVSFRNIKSEETVVHGLSFVPTKAGKTSIFVVFNSEQLIDVQGSLEVEVT